MDVQIRNEKYTIDVFIGSKFPREHEVASCMHMKFKK